MKPTTHRLIHILEEKNKSLEQFCALGHQRMACFQRGDFRQLKSFYQLREQLLQNISGLDGELASLGDTVAPPVLVDSQLKTQVLRLQKIRRHWVSQILWQDLQVLGFVEKAKSSMIRQLQSAPPGVPLRQQQSSQSIIARANSPKTTPRRSTARRSTPPRAPKKRAA